MESSSSSLISVLSDLLSSARRHPTRSRHYAAVEIRHILLPPPLLPESVFSPQGGRRIMTPMAAVKTTVVSPKVSKPR